SQATRRSRHAFPLRWLSRRLTLATASTDAPAAIGGSARSRFSLFTAGHSAVRVLQLRRRSLLPGRLRALSAAGARKGAPARGRRVRARRESHVELRPVAARDAALAPAAASLHGQVGALQQDRKSTRLNSSH